jgi:hypothetical protein
MLYSKHNFEIAEFCGNGDIRPELGGILVAPDKTVATDSFTLVEVTTPPDIPVEDFPAVPGCSIAPVKDRFIFPKAAAKLVLKSLPKKAGLPVLQRAATLQTEHGTAGFVTTNLETHTPTAAKVIDAQYPAYEPLFDKKDEPKSVVRVNAEYLERLGKFFKGFGSGHVRIKTYGESESIMFESETTEPQQARALLMPLRPDTK